MKQIKGKRTYIGIAILVLPILAQKLLGIELGGAEVQSIIDNMTLVVGSILSIYGRYDATK